MLPREIWWIILVDLSDIRQVVRNLLVCKTFYSIIRDIIPWFHLYQLKESYFASNSLQKILSLKKNVLDYDAVILPNQDEAYWFHSLVQCMYEDDLSIRIGKNGNIEIEFWDEDPRYIEVTRPRFETVFCRNQVYIVLDTSAMSNFTIHMNSIRFRGNNVYLSYEDHIDEVEVQGILVDGKKPTATRQIPENYICTFSIRDISNTYTLSHPILLYHIKVPLEFTIEEDKLVFWIHIDAKGTKKDVMRVPFCKDHVHEIIGKKYSWINLIDFSSSSFPIRMTTSHQCSEEAPISIYVIEKQQILFRKEYNGEIEVGTMYHYIE